MLLTYQGAPGDLIRASADAGAKGIVIGTAAGATSGTQGEGIRYAAEKNVIVVRATRTGAGRIMGGANANAPAGRGQPAGRHQRSERASAVGGRRGSRADQGAILLMLALTKTSDPQEIQRMFLEY